MRPPRPQPPWRRFKSPFISSAVKGSPAGTPSIIAVKRGPCDSPAVKYLILFLQIRFHLFKWYLIDGCTPQFRHALSNWTPQLSLKNCQHSSQKTRCKTLALRFLTVAFFMPKLVLKSI